MNERQLLSRPSLAFNDRNVGDACPRDQAAVNGSYLHWSAETCQTGIGPAYAIDGTATHIFGANRPEHSIQRRLRAARPGEEGEGRGEPEG